MANNDIIPPIVSNFVPGQVPRFYVADQSLLPVFIQTYYQWLEQSNNSLYYTRNFLNLIDVDNTIDEFLVWIKEKYLKNIQLNTQSNIRQLIKHSLDLYRAKGSEQALELLFRLVFNEAMSIYYPSSDLFKTSDGVWFKPKYLELSLSMNNRLLYQKKIQGASSKATAFVDSYIRRSIGDHLIDVIYISAIEGTFITGEIIVPVDNSLAIDQCPCVVGSLNEVIVPATGTSYGFNVGDIVSISSINGQGGVGRVSDVVNQTGIIDIEFVDGGYAFTSNSQLISSNSVVLMTVNNFTNSYARQYLNTFETIYQPHGIINYVNANNNFNVGDFIYTYYANSVVDGKGQLLTVSTTNSTAGQIQMSILSGNLNHSAIYSTGNTTTANLNVIAGFTDTSATAEVVGIESVLLTLSNTNGIFLPDEQIVQHNPTFDKIYPVAIAYNTNSIENEALLLSNTVGVFSPRALIHGVSSNATGWVSSVQLTVGIINQTNTFVTFNNNYVYSSGLNGSMTQASLPIQVSFTLSNTLNYSETVLINSDKLSSLANVHLNALTYGLAGNSTANSSSSMASCLSYSNVVIGQISTIYTSLGVQLDYSPLVIVYEPTTYSNRFDKALFLSNVSSNFLTGEIVTQEATNARGKIKSSNSSIMFIEDFRFNPNNQFVTTSNSSTVIVGSYTGSMANVIQIEDDLVSCHMGLNVNVFATTISSNGAISSLQVLDSGFGFINGETVTLSDPDSTPLSQGYGYASLITSGTGSGYYKVKGSFPSDTKKLFDGDYYQEYSYEVISSKMLDKYSEICKQLVHVAGTKMFGRLVHDQKNNVQVSGNPITITIK